MRSACRRGASRVASGRMTTMAAPAPATSQSRRSSTSLPPRAPPPRLRAPGEAKTALALRAARLAAQAAQGERARSRRRALMCASIGRVQARLGVALDDVRRRGAEGAQSCQVEIEQGRAADGVRARGPSRRPLPARGRAGEGVAAAGVLVRGGRVRAAEGGGAENAAPELRAAICRAWRSVRSDVEPRRRRAGGAPELRALRGAGGDGVAARRDEGRAREGAHARRRRRRRASPSRCSFCDSHSGVGHTFGETSSASSLRASSAAARGRGKGSRSPSIRRSVRLSPAAERSSSLPMRGR